MTSRSPRDFQFIRAEYPDWDIIGGGTTVLPTHYTKHGNLGICIKARWRSDSTINIWARVNLPYPTYDFIYPGYRTWHDVGSRSQVDPKQYDQVKAELVDLAFAKALELLL